MCPFYRGKITNNSWLGSASLHILTNYYLPLSGALGYYQLRYLFISNEVIRSNKHKGFTLIELVVVIVILGILASVAAPKFINLSSDARISILETLYASIKSAGDQTLLKARIVGADNNARSSSSNLPEVLINNQSMELKYGYPEAYAEGAGAGDIIDLIDVSEELEVCYSSSCISSNSSRVKVGFDTTENTGCYVRYSEPGGTGSPSSTEYGLIIVKDGC
jgi:MSHA pilin protein MshA